MSEVRPEMPSGASAPTRPMWTLNLSAGSPAALPQTSRPEGAFVLMLMQATFWVAAGISAFPFVLAGETFMAVLGVASLVLASFACVLAIGLVRRWRRARRWSMALESACLAGSVLLLAVPIGANRGPVSLMVNIALPVAVIVLLRGKAMRAVFSR